MSNEKGANLPWLPKGFEFLSGLPEAARRRAVIVAYQVYADESYRAEGGRTYVVGGSIATAEAWAAFSDEWRQCLDQPPTIRILKMKHADKARGSFNKWDRAAIDRKLLDLTRVICRHVTSHIFAAIDYDHHRASNWAKMPGPLKKPGVWAFHHIIIGTAFELWHRGVREPFEAFFDNGNSEFYRARELYPAFRALFRELEPDVSTILPADIFFRDDETFMPLQAAELFAGAARIATDSRDRSRFEPLTDQLEGEVPLSDLSRFYWENGLTSLGQVEINPKTLSYFMADSRRLVMKCIEMFPEKFR